MITHIFGGGTFSHVRSHLALAAPAFGETARKLYLKTVKLRGIKGAQVHLTKMADPVNSNLVTNVDVANRAIDIALRPDTAAIIMNCALCDWDGEIIEDGFFTSSGKHEKRLESRAGKADMRLTAAPKLLGRLRKANPYIVLVGFKTTCDATFEQMKVKSREQMITGAVDMVLANDVATRQNVIFTANGSIIPTKDNREEALDSLALLVNEQVKLRFPAATVGNV